MNNDRLETDILITGGTLLTMAPPGLILDNQVIGIRCGKILFVQQGPPPLSVSMTAREVVDASGCIVMPGLVNVHSHLAMTCFRGLADDLPLMTWLNDHIFPAEARFIDQKTVARRTGVSFQIHLAETREEVRLIRERYGRKPVQLLRDLDLLDEDTIAAHCIWLDGEELDLLAAGKVKVAHAPESNMKLGAGVAPVPEMLHLGIDVGLWTDGCASNNDLDLFGEMGMAAKLHKVFTGDPTVLPAEKVVEMATIGGACVLGMADRIGSITPGKEADIILVDIRKPHLTPLYNPFSHLVYAARGADVVTSIIGGRIVMKERRLLQIELAAVMEEVRMIADRIMEAGFHHKAGCL
ncbi:MAG: amidohydrolase family protein [Proteobacteria bacterium]|nr:amidohydrolase family protein [Pseudomonadota bacterium]MBU4583058.1 amidohydrolase family protein [Pseudomonadota bacterium]MCG2738870.1 amidohydrolase family protein [Syntrophaceae bacterium]